MIKGGPMHIKCPQCASLAFKKNGYTRHGKQNHRCLDCGKQFSFDEIDKNLDLSTALSLTKEHVQDILCSKNLG